MKTQYYNPKCLHPDYEQPGHFFVGEHSWLDLAKESYFTDVISGKPVYKITRVCLRCWEYEQFMTDAPGAWLQFKVDCLTK